MQQPILLVIDSNPALLQALRLWLAALFPQCRMKTARTGASGIRAARTCSPSIVVLDVRLPRLNGIETARRIKLYAPDTEIVFFTLCDAAAYRTAATQAGACGYVQKHRAEQDLRPLLGRLLDGRVGRRSRKTIVKNTQPILERTFPSFDRLASQSSALHLSSARVSR